jgi:hypothetical protein
MSTPSCDAHIGSDSDGVISSDYEDSDTFGHANSERNSLIGVDLGYRAISACIPNHEIRMLFCRWLRNCVSEFLKQSKSTDIKPGCVRMFQQMAFSSMALFAKAFSELIQNKMPVQFRGRKEYVYQSFLCAFISAAGDAFSSFFGSAVWEVEVERCSGLGRLDLMLWQVHGHVTIIIEFKRIAVTDKDRKSGYSDSQCQRLTTEAEEALKQIRTINYRATVRHHVTEVREYGISFLGLYCAVVGQVLQRNPGEQWRSICSYTSEMNEKLREELYMIAS